MDEYNHKKRILFVNASLQIGGVERSLLNILRNFDYDSYEVFLYLDDTERGFANEVPASVKVVLPNMNDLFGGFTKIAKMCIKQRRYSDLFLRTVRLLASKTNERVLVLLKFLYKRYGEFDCVIGFREGFYTQFAMYAFRAKKYIGWWHGAVVPKSLDEYSGIEDLSTIVGVSSGVSRMLSEVFPQIKAEIVTVPNMIDSTKTAFVAAASVKFTRNVESQFFLVTVCRLSPEKHVENVIYCANMLRKKNIEFKWCIVGGGAEYEKISKMISDNNLHEYVVMVGECQNPYPYFKDADLFVHTSYIESQGLTILEAMALDVPCVVTKSLGPCEFIQDGVNGILTEQSPESLAEKVLEMLTNQTLYEQIKANTHCPEQFAPETVMTKIEELLKVV